MEFIDLQAQYKKNKTLINARIQAVLDHGRYIFGPEVAELESRLADYVGAKHCIAVASGTVALQVAMMSLGIEPGDEVITSPFSFFASVSTILQLGAKPIFVDIDSKTCNIDPDKIAAAITSKTKLIMPVSLFGQCADFDKINAIAKQYNIPVIEDAAQSFGAEYKGRFSCNLSTIGCTSFFPSKPLGCYGDAGACFTNDAEIAAKIRTIVNHGQHGRYNHVVLGFNGRCVSLQAAILLAKFDNFADEVNLRQEVAKYYSQQLAGLVQTPYIEPFNKSVYAQYTVLVPNRDKVQQHLSACDIPTAVHYPKPIYKQPVWQQYADVPSPNLPVVEHAAQCVLSLPFDPYLSIESINQVCKELIVAVEHLPANITSIV